MFFLLILPIFLLLRILGLTAIPVFCDEAIYINWSQKMLESLRLYKFVPLTDGKTPLFMWLDIPFQAIFKDPLYSGRILSVLAGAATLYGVYYLGKKHFNINVGKTAALFVAVVPFSVFFDRMALADSLLASFSIWSLILALNLTEKFDYKTVLLLSLTLGGGILTKTPGFFSFITLPLVILNLKFSKEKLSVVIKKIGGLISASLLGWGVYNLLRFSPDFSKLSSRNTDYYFPVTRLISSPFNPFLGHLKDLADWFPKLLTWPVLILLFAAIFLIFYRRHITLLIILFWALAPLMVMMLLLKTFTARYILFSVIPFIFLAAWALTYIYDLLPFKKVYFTYVILTLFLLIQSFYFDYFLIVDPQKAPLPHEERHGYLEDWTAGYGLKEIAGYLNNIAKNKKIVVVTEGSFGTLPDGLKIYWRNNPNIDVWYSTSVLTDDVYKMTGVMPVYFVVNKSHLAFNRGLHLLKEYPRAAQPGQPTDALLVYSVEE